MFSLAALVAFLLALFGPAVAAYWFVPAEALAVWPVLLVTFAPTVLALISMVVFYAERPSLVAPLPVTAATWLVKTLERKLLPIKVATLERRENHHGNFFHPPSGTIVLAEDVHGEYTARAYATAAHELGHAMLYLRKHWLARVAMLARENVAFCFQLGAGLMVGAALAGGTSVRIAALVMMTVAVVLQAFVVVDEAIASLLGGQALREELSDEQARVVRNHLRRALLTYIAALFGYVVPIVAAPWLFARFGDGVLVPAAPLTGNGATVASVIAVTCVLGLLVGVRDFVRANSNRLSLVVGFAMMWLPLLFVLVCTQALPAWTVAVAAGPAWWILSTPFGVAAGRFAGAFDANLDHVPLAVGPGSLSIGRVSLEKLRAHEVVEGRFTRARGRASLLWALPLAIAWLLA